MSIEIAGALCSAVTVMAGTEALGRTTVVAASAVFSFAESGFGKSGFAESSDEAYVDSWVIKPETLPGPALGSLCTAAFDGLIDGFWFVSPAELSADCSTGEGEVAKASEGETGTGIRVDPAGIANFETAGASPLWFTVGLISNAPTLVTGICKPLVPTVGNLGKLVSKADATSRAGNSLEEDSVEEEELSLV